MLPRMRLRTPRTKERNKKINKKEVHNKKNKTKMLIIIQTIRLKKMICSRSLK